MKKTLLFLAIACLSQLGFAQDGGDPIVVDSVVITASVNTITVDDGFLQVSATVYPLSVENRNVQFSVDNSDLATVDATGKVIAKRNGTVVLKAVAEANTSAFSTLSIAISNQVVQVERIEVTALSTSISEDNGTLQVSATVYPIDAANKAVTFKVSDETLASVSATGLVTAIKDGTVKVIATSVENDKISGEMSITITNQVGINDAAFASLKVYPNPAVAELNVENTESVETIRVISILGNVVGVYQVKNNIEKINVSELNSGVYFLQVVSKQGTTASYKFIKK